MAIILTEKNTVANHFIAEMRDVNIQKDKMRFRRNMERIGEVLAYEISKDMNYELSQVETPLGIAPMNLINERIVLCTIIRAGNPLHQGFLNYFDSADSAFISAFRKHHKDGSFEINLEYISTPNLDDCTLIVTDAMLATGATVDITLKALKDYGTPRKVHLACILASSYGLEYVSRLHPDVKIWLGALDDELTAKSYIVPGLGDAGDLAFGPKLNE